VGIGPRVVAAAETAVAVPFASKHDVEEICGRGSTR